LAAPILVSPVNGATGISVTPTLDWDTVVGATNFLLEVATDSSFISIILSDSTFTLTSRAVSGLSNSTRYFWRVNASNAGGTSAWSTVWSFTTTGTGGLIAPVLISPANSATGVSINPTMVWNSVAGAATYNLQVSTVSTFASRVVDDTLTSTSQAVSGLSNGTHYFWRVNAKNAGGTSVWSTAWSFTTETGSGGLAAPTLVSPVNGATGVSITPTLVWNASSGATNYLLQLATDSAFISIILSDSTSTSTSQAVGSLVNSTAYYWRVRAENATGSSAWSTVSSFTTGPNTSVVRYPAGSPKSLTQPVTVYNLLGRKVSRGVPVGYRAMTSGCYIYKTGDRTKKNTSLR
jgi:hypothetical protein